MKSEATNCFSINFQVSTNNNQHKFTKIHFKFIAVKSNSHWPVTITFNKDSES